MEESFTEHLLNQCKNDREYTGVSQFGVFSGKVLGEINEQRYYYDMWENVLTVLFVVGVVLIPIQLIFADDLKYVDMCIMNVVHNIFANSDNSGNGSFIYNCISFCSDISFYMSILVFIYIAVDSGIAFKTLIIGTFPHS